MIDGAHIVLYSRNAEADRDFFRDVLRFDSADAGHGWLIFALPPSEVAFHPAASNERPELYLMCDDLAATMAELQGKGVRCGAVHDERWGQITTPLKRAQRNHAVFAGRGHARLVSAKTSKAAASQMSDY